MPKPTSGDVHVNRPLTNISVAFMQDQKNFVASQVFPNIPVQSKSDVFFTYDRGEFNRDEMKQRAPGTESAGGGFSVSTDSYSAKVYAFHKDIDDQLRANADAPLNLDREATEYVTLKALLKREKIWTSSFFTTGKWTTDVTGAATSPGTGEVLQWNDAASTPIENVRTGKATILESTGLEPNTLVLGYRTFLALVDHPDIVDRVKYSGGVGNDRPAMVGINALQQLLDIERILVMKSIENTAAEDDTNVHAFIGGKHALLCHAASSPGIMTASAGYTFSWTGLIGSGNQGNRIKRFRMEHLESDRVEIQMAFDMKKVAADLGYFFSGIVA
jgi:hypothetical protein